MTGGAGLEGLQRTGTAVIVKPDKTRKDEKPDTSYQSFY